MNYRLIRLICTKASTMLLASVLLAFFCAPRVSAKPSVPSPTDTFYVGDFANVLESATVEKIVSINDRLFEETGAQIVFVTVDFLDGEDIADYAAALFNEWGIGSSERNNGILVLLAIGEDNYHALQGEGLEDSLSSGVLGDLLYEYLEPDFAKKDYDAGVNKLFPVLVDAIEKIYPADGGGIYSPVQPDYGETPEYSYPQKQPRRVFYIPDFFKAFAVFIVIVVFLSLFGAFRRRPRRGYYTPPPLYGRPRHPGYYRQPPPPPPPYRPSGGGFFGGFSSGGSSHGGGASRSSFGSSSRGGSSRGGGGRSGGGSRSGGGGSSRGGGAGRR